MVSYISNQEIEEKSYWFPAKKYGWGWSFPKIWQGWATLATYFLAIAIDFYLFPPKEDKNVLAFVLIVMLLSAALIGVCLIKGEPPAKGKKTH